MTTTTNTTPEQAHDEHLFVLSAAISAAQIPVERAVQRGRSGLGHKQVKWGRSWVWEKGTDAVLAELSEHPADERVPGYYGPTFGDFVAAIVDARTALRAAYDALDDHESNYTGWARYFLLTSSDGHVHRSTNCSTCNKGGKPSTFVLWARLSGVTEAVAVEALGPALCSVCYPAAPVEWQDGARVPARLALVLLNEGEAAFTVAREKAAQKAAQKADKRCEGSGKYVPRAEGARPALYGRAEYRRCPDCGENTPITSTTSLLRAHDDKRKG